MQKYKNNWRTCVNKFKIVNKIDDALIKEMIELDKLFFKGDDIAEFNRCKEWINKNSDIYTVLMQDDEVIGYINFMPVTDETYQAIKQGKLKDYELNASHIVKFIKDVPLKCLLASIVVREEHQDTETVIELWNGLLKKLQSLNVTISSVVADCVSADGEKFAKQRLNAKFITNSNGGKVFEGDIRGLNGA